jgi:SAM-dependent methyltransferase
VSGREALDFGCGAGRSTRFLKRLGFRATGIDISASMIRLARSADPEGAYRQVADGDFGPIRDSRFDLVLSAFAFDNIPGTGRRRDLLRGLASLLAPGGRIVLLGSTPEIYWHEWTSFTTRDFPENRVAKSGERVRIIMKDVTDQRPVVDVIWFPDDYLATFGAASLRLVAQHRPLGRRDEGRAWISETTVAPWVIYVLEPGT